MMTMAWVKPTRLDRNRTWIWINKNKFKKVKHDQKMATLDIGFQYRFGETGLDPNSNDWFTTTT